MIVTQQEHVLRLSLSERVEYVTVRFFDYEEQIRRLNAIMTRTRPPQRQRSSRRSRYNVM